MADDVLEDEGRTVRVGRLAHVGRDLELGADGFVDVDELAGVAERVEVGAEVRHRVPPCVWGGYRSTEAGPSHGAMV